MISRGIIIVIYVLILGLFSSCGRDYAPKPRGFFRIKFPAKKYQTFKGTCRFQFDYPTYASIEPDTNESAKPCWFDVVFSPYNARIHLSYYPIASQKVFNELVEDARTFAFKHTVKATAIDESIISFPEERVYGILYSIEGNSASSVQFFVTDSTRNYLRGALYFHERPRLDSVKPVLDFLKEDVRVMIKSMKWH